MRRHNRDKRIVVPSGQTDYDQRQHGKQDEKLQRGGEFPHHLNPAYIDVSNHPDHDQRDDPVSPSREFREIEAQIIGKLHRVNAAEQE